MDSLSPFLQDSFIPHFMPVYPGAPQKSTGPSSPEGKCTSSHNALKTGLTGRTILLPSEDVAAYQKIVSIANEQWRPESDAEKLVVQSIADTQ